MMRRLAILCPGQGGQHAGMFDMVRGAAHALPALEKDAPDHALPAGLEDALGMPLDAALRDDAALFANRVAQPLLVACAAAHWHALRGRLPEPALAAGYSIGELSAHAVAGSVAAADAIGLAARRAALMDDCANAPEPQRMLAVSGMALPELRAMLGGAALHIAIETGEDSAIVGGMAGDADACAERLRQRGCRVQALPVTVASHTPLMQEAASRFLAELRGHPLAAPAFPVLCGISGASAWTAEDARAALSRQIAEAIRWQDCMDACAEAGISIALELGPGSALSRMLRERHPHIECRSLADFRTLDGAAGWVSRHFA